MLRRRLQALAGQRAEALDTMVRLKIFATELHDWPTQLASTYKMIDEVGTLGAFKAELVKLYGEPAGQAQSEEDDDDE